MTLQTDAAPLAPPVWHALESTHATRADALTSAHRARKARGEKHPVEDFLFTYYGYKPAVLRRWHPGIGVALADPDGVRAQWRHYRTDDGVSAVHAAALAKSHGDLIARVGDLLTAVHSRRGMYGCFGLHEWAMVYRAPETRHEVPLRLGSAGTDAVVEASVLQCSHVDAVRFFTPAALPRNAHRPTREMQRDFDQPGCLHVNMDLYKWAIKLGPLVPGEVLLDAFELARDIRELDMRASPYDLGDWGYEPVRIETPDGKAAYVSAQRAFTARADEIRGALLAVHADYTAALTRSA
ncbi:MULTISPECIES: 3-methyladenine DNA glycosylase [Microbacterium]|uniref:3-methyladenine DNA glycosylase n=1 Tax=Microbacterium TaxID=33882 RepID=UPI002016A41F|nr:3-methyladenine DNA glycosylase [Microbacterium sp. 4NA327F11]MCK9914664.1 3-methyladenine DNA glycosylase [Microbacteriaceae bacterium K1510]